MPKEFSDKEKDARKRRRSSKNRGTENEDNRASKKKKIEPADGIAKSRQLTEKLQRTRSTRASTNRKNELRICGNGKPMPSLADLERMFDDSEDEQVTSPVSKDTILKRPKTPDNKLSIDVDNIKFSPNTIKKIATNMIHMLDKLPTIVLDDDPPAPIVPPKKRKRPNEPYIVGCKDREQKPWCPKISFCKGEPDYGVDQNAQQSEENNCPKKRQKRSSKVNISKSIFNARSNEIAATLQNSDHIEQAGNGSPDSNTTVDYDYSSPSQMARSFSPLPSTSKDNETILKNELRFNESLQIESCFDISSQNDVEIIGNPCEIVVVDDTLPNRSPETSQALYNDTDDDCYIIVSPEDTQKRDTTSPIRIDSPKDEFYGSLNLNHNYENDVCEIIDVDEVIAENKAIIEKYHRNSNLDTVTLVEPRQGMSQIDTAEIPVTTNATHLSNTVQVQSSQTHPNQNPLIDSDISRILNIDPTVTGFDIVIHSQNSPNVHDIPEDQYSPNPENNVITVSAPMGIFSVISNLERLCSNGGHHRRRRTVNANPRNSRRHMPLMNTVEEQNDSVNQISNNNASNFFMVTGITNVPANQSPTTEGVSTQPVEPEPSTNRQGARDCPICLDSLSSKAAASTFCGHIFCMTCIKAAFKANGKKCPTCRKVLKSGVGYHPLFL